MTDTNNIFSPPDASAVLALMKSFNDQQLASMPMDLTEPRETEELRNRLLAAAMSMMDTFNTHSCPWLTESQIPMPNSKAEMGMPNLDDLSLPSQFFSGLATPSSEATTSPPSDFPFSNPFLMVPSGLQGIGGAKCILPIVNGNKDEDFCELCQKHFCNKYYLRKHKGDVHRIPSEPFSQIKKREVGSGEPDDNDPYTNDWTHILTSSTATTQRLGESQLNRKTSMEGFRSILDLGETNVPSEMEQASLWTPKPEPKPSRVELSENATFIPPTVAFESVSSPTISSTVTCTSANSGALDMFKSSMAAAKLADRVTCELCKKELCNKYFLRTHKIKVHGLSPQEVGGGIARPVGGKNTEKLQTEDGNQGLEAFCSPPPLPPPLSLMTPMLPSQFPAPLGGLPPWPPSQPPSTMSEMPKPPQEEASKDPVLQLMGANALIACPLCDKTIGPRLFLPTHLTSAHSLSPADPSFFIFILSARTLDIDGVAKITPSSDSDRGSPTSAAFQIPNISLMRRPSTTFAEPIDREQAGVLQLAMPNSMNDHSVFPPPISINEMGIGGSGFDLSIMATASNTPLSLYPPPLGLLSSQPGLYPAPPAIQLPLTPTTPLISAGTVIDPTATAATTTKWNPVHLAASGLAVKRALPNGSTGAAPRKSPNQMRVLCDICNKWICNKYFLRTHKANKHGITDKARVMTSTSQAVGFTTKGMTAVPLDFSKPWKMQQYYQQQQPPLFISGVTSDFFSTGIGSGMEDASVSHPPIMSRWLFTHPNPHSPISRSPRIPPASNDSADFEDNCADRGCPLNLSIKMSPQPQLGSEIKHGIEQFLSNFPVTTTRRRPVKVRRRHLQLHKRAAHVLVRAYKHLSAFHGTASLTTSSKDEIDKNRNEGNESRPWQNVCKVCKVSFNKRNQLGAHCYTDNHQHCSQIPIPTPINSFPTSTDNCSPSVNVVTHNLAAQICSDSSMNAAGDRWARQQKWPINFARTKSKSHQFASGKKCTTAEQFCSYQASHHLIQPHLFNETTTTSTT